MRLAMLALLLVAKAETEGAGTVLQQAAHPSWPAVVGLALVVWGTLAPVRAGAIDEPFGIFTPRAERVNGRLAMLGWAGLLTLEYYTGLPFF